MKKDVYYYNWNRWQDDLKNGRVGRLSSTQQRWRAIAREKPNPVLERWILASSKKGDWGVIAWLKIRAPKEDEPVEAGDRRFWVYYDEASSFLFADPKSGEMVPVEKITRLLTKKFPDQYQGLAGTIFIEAESRTIVQEMEKEKELRVPPPLSLYLPAAQSLPFSGPSSADAAASENGPVETAAQEADLTPAASDPIAADPESQGDAEASPKISAAARKAGLEAEDWLRKNIGRWLPPGWKVADDGGGNKPFDMSLYHEDSEVIVEAKTDPGFFFWSENEVRRANKATHYLIALVGKGDSADNRSVRWIVDPRSACARWSLAGIWSFPDVRVENGVTSWERPDHAGIAPTKPPSFSYEVTIPRDEQLPGDGTGRSFLNSYLSRLTVANGPAAA